MSDSWDHNSAENPILPSCPKSELVQISDTHCNNFMDRRMHKRQSCFKPTMCKIDFQMCETNLGERKKINQQVPMKLQNFANSLKCGRKCESCKVLCKFARFCKVLRTVECQNPNFRKPNNVEIQTIWSPIPRRSDFGHSGCLVRSTQKS